jgi:peroxiredoxin
MPPAGIPPPDGRLTFFRMKVANMSEKKYYLLALTALILVAALAPPGLAQERGDEAEAATEAEEELGEIIGQIRVKMQTEPPGEIVKMAEDLLGNFIGKYKGRSEEAQARIVLGQVYTAVGRNPEAITEYELALDAADRMETREKALLMFYLASSYAQEEKFESAEKMYRRILDESSPEDTRVRQAVQKEMKMLEARKKLSPGSPAIAFPEDARTLDGKEISLSDYRGKVVLIDFWATWCKPCRNEMPNVMELYEEFSDDGFVIIGVSLDRTREALVSYIEEKDIEWPQIYDGQGGRIATSYAVSAIPATFLLNRKGEILHRDLRGKALEEAVSGLFKKD